MAIPNNVMRFEVLLYLSLMLDSLSAAFLDRASGDPNGATAATVNMVAVILLGALVYLVWLAARHRKSWARWTLVGALGLSVVSLMDALGDSGLALGNAVDVVSTALTGAGIYFSFTGDARNWFNA